MGSSPLRAPRPRTARFDPTRRRPVRATSRRPHRRPAAHRSDPPTRPLSVTGGRGAIAGGLGSFRLMTGFRSRAYSWREPVLEPQSGDILKMPGVVRHERQVVVEGYRSDHQIDGISSDAEAFEPASQLAELLRAGFVEAE